MKLTIFLNTINEAASDNVIKSIQLLSNAIAQSRDSQSFDGILWDDDDVVDQASALLKDQYDMISRGGNIKVYRMICVKDINSIDKNNLGASWTNDAGSASCWNEESGSSGFEFLIVGNVNSDDVVWIETLYHNLHGDFYDENEIRLLPNRKIQIEGIVQRSGRNNSPVTGEFVGSTGTAHHNDIANRGHDFIKYYTRLSGIKEEKMTDVWHLTDKQNVPSIMKNGLEPRIGAKSKSASEKKNRIYVFPDLRSVEDALTNWWYDNTEYRQALLQLRVPASWITQDQVRWEATIDRTIPPEMIAVKYDDVSDLASL